MVLAFAPCRLGLIGIRETDPEDSFDPIEVERVALKISHQNGDVIGIGQLKIDSTMLDRMIKSWNWLTPQA